MPASGQSSGVVKYPEAKGMGNMDGYEFSFEIVRSLAGVALVTAIATSLGTGFCTYFVTVHGKEKEWQRSEKTRKEARLYQQRSRQYELLQPILLRVVSLGKSRLGWGITPQPGVKPISSRV